MYYIIIYNITSIIFGEGGRTDFDIPVKGGYGDILSYFIILYVTQLLNQSLTHLLPHSHIESLEQEGKPLTLYAKEYFFWDFMGGGWNPPSQWKIHSWISKFFFTQSLIQYTYIPSFNLKGQVSS